MGDQRVETQTAQERHPQKCGNCCLTLVDLFLPPLAVTLKIGRGCGQPECFVACCCCIVGAGVGGIFYGLYVIYSGNYDEPQAANQSPPAAVIGEPKGEVENVNI